MPSPTLNHRTILRYNRLSRHVAALLAALRNQKSAAASSATVQQINEVHALARKVYGREPDMPRFSPLPANASLTHYDMRLLVQQLLAAGLAFETRYRHIGDDDTDLYQRLLGVTR